MLTSVIVSFTYLFLAKGRSFLHLQLGLLKEDRALNFLISLKMMPRLTVFLNADKYWVQLLAILHLHNQRPKSLLVPG